MLARRWGWAGARGSRWRENMQCFIDRALLHCSTQCPPANLGIWSSIISCLPSCPSSSGGKSCELPCLPATGRVPRSSSKSPASTAARARRAAARCSVAARAGRRDGCDIAATRPPARRIAVRADWTGRGHAQSLRRCRQRKSARRRRRRRVSLPQVVRRRPNRGPGEATRHKACRWSTSLGLTARRRAWRTIPRRSLDLLTPACMRSAPGPARPLRQLLVRQEGLLRPLCLTRSHCMRS